MFHRILAGAAGGAIGGTISFPLENIKRMANFVVYDLGGKYSLHVAMKLGMEALWWQVAGAIVGAIAVGTQRLNLRWSFWLGLVYGFVVLFAFVPLLSLMVE
jgi:hypothetical protein